MSTNLFCSWVRRGAASGITEADPLAGPYPVPATFDPSVTFSKDGVTQPAATGPNLQLIGPGAILGLHHKAIARTDPASHATGVEDNYLALVELTRPDLPWLFTPASANNQNRLRPWMVLVVVVASTVSLEQGTPLPRITVNDSQLPDLNDSWAWATILRLPRRRWFRHQEVRRLPVCSARGACKRTHPISLVWYRPR
jgi:hypothetical protein